MNILIDKLIVFSMCFSIFIYNVDNIYTVVPVLVIVFLSSINSYMEREVLPYIPDATAFFEENLTAKKPVIKTGAEIPFTRTFYRYQAPATSEVLENRFTELEQSVSKQVEELFG